MERKHSIELLNTVFQDADMSKAILYRLIKLNDSLTISKALATEFAEYHNIVECALQLASKMNIELSAKNHAKSVIFCSVRMNTLFDKSPEHIAEMLVQGNVMGMIDMKRAIKENPDADKAVTSLASRLYNTELNNMKNMLEYC